MIQESPIIRRFAKQRYLFASLVIMLIAGPIGQVLTGEGPSWLIFAALVCVFVTGPLAVASTPTDVRIAAVLGDLTMGSGLTGEFMHATTAAVVATLIGIGFFGFLMVLETRSLLFRRQQVNEETLWAAVNVYILMALLFAFVYAAVNLLLPGSFASNLDAPSSGWQIYGFLYFSFVTITTLGYGDITPTNTVIGTFAYLEALLGQLYIAIMMARLVGLYVSNAPEE